PIGRNSPQKVPHGLYAEKFSGTAFTAPKARNFRTWFYRIRPSVTTVGFAPLEHPTVLTAPLDTVVPPDPIRWDPLPVPDSETDFIDGLYTLAACGDAGAQTGAAIHLYCANRSMTERFFYSSDGEFMIVPELGALTIHTECGVLETPPGHIAVIPRGMRFRVELQDEQARGYVCENYGAMFELPERGPIGSDSLANSRDFEAPVAAYDDREGDFELVCKLDGRFFSAKIGHSPLDVVAWHGTLYPYRYDLWRFNTIGSISYDHPDPSIFTVLTSQSDTPGTANVDFVIFPPRWLVMEDTFRPPWYHRNVMSEFMGLIKGVYDAKPSGGFAPGASSLHNSMSPHGPDAAAWEKASNTKLQPEKLDDTMAFMFESRYLIRPTSQALTSPQRQADYLDVWSGLQRRFKKD
ncbi:MAG: homogentisate 1,2-dioxygenase, partial [Gammaproteobacteria bacterium]|nr:homogentisate 1,2-dioxygenase [Gammaproteobacteria bacterium]